ncbi:hypothetical protein [Streptococcus sp. zg-JUN1979]|uniref:hypothetical protein n=1 Tax=Streptococcus sp. zg-JUN1979 TaxID=3391450 RepID=UPI0039A7374A
MTHMSSNNLNFVNDAVRELSRLTQENRKMQVELIEAYDKLEEVTKERDYYQRICHELVESGEVPIYTAEAFSTRFYVEVFGEKGSEVACKSL